MRQTMLMQIRNGISICLLAALFGCQAPAERTAKAEVYVPNCERNNRLIACDNLRFPGESSRCSDDFDHETMSVALFDRLDGVVIARLKDGGDGIPYVELDSPRTGGRNWMRVRVCDIYGWVDWDEGFHAVHQVSNPMF